MKNQEFPKEQSDELEKISRKIKLPDKLYPFILGISIFTAIACFRGFFKVIQTMM